MGRNLLNNRLRKSGRNLKVGEIYFLMGTGTKVIIVSKAEFFYPECKILEASKDSKYSVNQIARISCCVLYPFKGRKTPRN